MRITFVVIAAVIVGTSIGAAAALFEFHRTTDVLMPLAVDLETELRASDAPAARASIEETEFYFDSMQRGTKKSHLFTIKNVGNAPLTIRLGPTSCKCTLGVASDQPIPPGESTDVRLEWTANVDPGPFRQSATLLTNDPRRPQITLTIQGDVTDAKGVEPREFLFDKLTAGESKSASIFVLSFLEDSIRVTEPELSRPETRDFFDVQIEGVPREELPNPDAKAGVRVTLRVKPGLPLGIFNQRLKLRTSLQDAEELEIPVVGRVVGDISVHGADWDDRVFAVRLGPVKSAHGKRAALNLVVRGPAAAETEFQVAATDPPEMIARLGEPRRLRDDLVHVPLEVEVPPGTPPMARLGTEQGDEGRVLLDTTHPAMPKLELGVRFTVER
jgi:hypothetical protein